MLIGTSVMTNDEMMAFIFSVDLCFNVNDLANLKPVLRRGVARQKEFFHVFIEQVRAGRAGVTFGTDHSVASTAGLAAARKRP